MSVSAHVEGADTLPLPVGAGDDLEAHGRLRRDDVGATDPDDPPKVVGGLRVFLRRPRRTAVIEVRRAPLPLPDVPHAPCRHLLLLPRLAPVHSGAPFTMVAYSSYIVKF